MHEPPLASTVIPWILKMKWTSIYIAATCWLGSVMYIRNMYHDVYIRNIRVTFSNSEWTPSVANGCMVAHYQTLTGLQMEKRQIVGSDFAGLGDWNLSIPIKIPQSQAQAINRDCEHAKGVLKCAPEFILSAKFTQNSHAWTRIIDKKLVFNSLNIPCHKLQE